MLINSTIKNKILEDKFIFIFLFAYIFLLLFFCSKMSPLYPINEWADVNLYFNIGKGIFNGKVPYADTFDHKGPLIFFIYGIGYLISNTSFLGMYFIQGIMWVLIVSFAYLIGRIYLDKVYAFLVAVLLPSLMLSYTATGGSAEEFVLAAECISLYLFLLYFDNQKVEGHNPAYMVVHGVMLAVVLFIKSNLVVFWVFPLAAVFVNIILNKDYRGLLKNLGALLLGILIVTLPLVLYFALNGALGEAWHVYVVLNKSYSNPGTIGQIIERLYSTFYQSIRFGSLVFIIMLIGAFVFPFMQVKNRLGGIAIVLSFLSLYAAVYISVKNIPYYTIPFFVYALLGCLFICRYIRLGSSWYLYPIIALITFYIGIKQINLFGYTFDELRTEQPDNGVSRFSAIIKKEKDPSLLNLGLDLGNTVFTETGIVPSVKYFVSPNLNYSVFPEMRNEQEEYIRQERVQFVILSEASLNFDYFFGLPLLYQNYEVVDSFKDQESKAYYLFKRKD